MGVTASPLTRNVVQRFERRKTLVGIVNSRTFPNYGNVKSRWHEKEEIFTLPSCFFFSMIALVNLEELDGLMPCDTILLI
jgi:hypothetical protein